MMLKKLKGFLGSFIAGKAKREVRELYGSVAISNLARFSVSTFETVYLYKIGFTIPQILLFYLAIYVLLFFIVPLGMSFACSRGYEHTILYSSPFWIIYYLCLFAIPYNIAFILIAVVAISVRKSTYWFSFHADFAEYSVPGERARESSNMYSINNVVSVIAPLMAGLVLKFTNFSVLFVIVIILFFISNIPLLSTKEVFVPRKHKYWDSMRLLFSKKKRKELFSHFAYGEEFVWMLLWPLFIFIVIGDYLIMGSIMAVASLSVVLLSLYIGKTADKKGKHRVLRVGTIFYSFSYFVRVLVNSTFGIFLAETYSRLANRIVYIPKIALLNREACNKDTAKNILFFIQSLVMGKIFIILACFLIFTFVPGILAWQAVFVMAGLITFLYLLTP